MDSYSARGNTIFCTFVTVLGTFGALNHCTSYLPAFQPKTEGTLKVNEMTRLTKNSHFGFDQAEVTFDINYNLSEEFHWNSKQLFVYLVAVYKTDKHKRNEVTLWDCIVSRDQKEDEGCVKELQARALKAEYLFSDPSKELRDNNYHLEIRYRTMPIIGIMHTKELCKSDEEHIKAEYFQPGGTAKGGAKGSKRLG
mmetsp:Transcript_76998/g.121581  ORF Transcript_76998/g.121581 Transcript_76998/m.121581 type:complete len:196 (+) Transcript_76998:78-665(+)|eukprot:CAMPEP_0169114526 /NCGR_PEP_ID=MMETSP1015-20121227/28805_1 /TAXON_ID=342587 /ORGANISM="Karlodinium micrum, Strain CCMP2283" /LENGTH=195 /DNA_ID=CAMNT_0009176815 /DNA_START=77 /DNA_END=664 /DNA_ORIENTATION=+